MSITALEIRPEEIGRFDPRAHLDRKRRMWAGISTPKPFRPVRCSEWRKETVPAPCDPSFDAYQEKDRLFDDGVVGALKTVSGRAPPKPSLKWILDKVAEAHGFTIADLRGSYRNTLVVAARHEFCWLARRYSGQSFPMIGQFLGARDHTTILHGYQKIDGLVAKGARELKAHEVVRAAFEAWVRNGSPAAMLAEG